MGNTTDKQFTDNTTLTFQKPLARSINFNYMCKKTPTEGNIVYEYNPFRNYRIDRDMFEYEGHLYTQEELKSNFGIIDNNGTWQATKPGTDLQTLPVLVEAGSLVDFETDQLQFDIQHPVDIIPQYSYDGSVNLIFNDGKNIPRLVNSRFTTLSKNTYKVMDRKGNNDTNIYDQGAQFDIDTSLYKRVVEIPELEFFGVTSGGNLKAGNYVFYFKYADADGNETDFVAESGLVSLFIGTELDSVRQGFREENTHKSVRFFISNIDSGYSYVSVYFTRASGDVDGNPTRTAHRIEKKFEVNKALNCIINVTGYEDITDIPLSDINIQYNIASAVDAQAACQNMLFLGNIHRPDINYKELTDLSLRFLPTISTKSYTTTGYEYSETVKNTYADPNFIYKYTGYMNGEIYHLGIVYILSDNTLSPVFNIRGRDNLTTGNPEGQYNTIPVFNGQNRVYISSDENTGEIIYSSTYTVTSDESNNDGSNNTTTSFSNKDVENVWGLVRLNIKPKDGSNDSNTIYGIKIQIDKGEDVLNCLKALGIKGFFFVRQKRIPLRLCQALTIGIERESCTPVLPVSTKSIKSYKSDVDIFDSDTCYIAERFLNDDRKLTEDFIDRVYPIDKKNVSVKAAICPEYDVNPQYFNQLFTGSEFYVTQANFQSENKYLSMDVSSGRHFFIESVTDNKDTGDTTYATDIVSVPDDTAVVMYQDQKYRGRAGEAEEAWRFQYLERKNKVDDASNLLRGSYGPFIGISGYSNPCSIININTPDYYNMSIHDMFEVRHIDQTPYYAISKRYALRDYDNSFDDTLYRGDSFICTFTHRLNRNFQDPEAPTNDEIVDADTWVENYEEGNKENLQKINRGDVNAIPLGMWVTFPLVSSMNLNVRALDPSFPTEEGLTGHKRGFHPYYPASTDGTYKISESTVHNGGYTTTVGEKENFVLPDVPYIKNEFVTRILYSDIHINDAFKNGFRVFQLSHYRDYPRTYGSIIKLVEIQGNLLCVFEHGVALIPVNERAVAGEGSGGTVFINTSNVLPENPRMLSDMYGSQWAESVIKTPYYVYGVDTIGKKIWRTNGQEFEIISDFKIQKFLNDNISLTERELTPIIGIRNVKTHYNAFKQDVMFTFYDNLKGFEEKVWNICYNELLQKWITFYSWVPSYSANIDNLFFTFDRNTSKAISKLGISKQDSDFAEGIVLSNNVFSDVGEVGTLSLQNVKLPTTVGTKIEVEYTWSLERDNEQNYKNFEIEGDTLKFIGNYEDLKANIFSYNPETGKRVFKNPSDIDYNDKIVILLNTKCSVTLKYNGDDNNIKQYTNGWNEKQSLDYGIYQTVVAVIPEYNQQFLTTDFWKHGQSGIIDIADKIKPTVWYGKQHPFEFEFVVVDNPQFQKIFNNLQIISNKAKPESFHYEVVGESYDFAPDKQNIFIRQELLKAFYQYNGSDILYNRKFLNLTPKQGVKSTMFPLYYSRQDKLNTIEDYYHNITTENKDFVNLSGSEIVYDELLGEFKVWTHAKAHDIAERGRIRGNMHYLEDLWDIQINPIVFIQKNEIWGGTYKLLKGYYPVSYTYKELTNKILDSDNNVYNLTWETKQGVANIDITEVPNPTKFDVRCNTTFNYIGTPATQGLYGKTKEQPVTINRTLPTAEQLGLIVSDTPATCSTDDQNYNIGNKVFVQAELSTYNGYELVWTSYEPIDTRVPLVVGNTPIPGDMKGFDIDTSSTDVSQYMSEDILKFNKNYTWKDIDTSNWTVFAGKDGKVYPNASARKETKIRDKYLKVRVRYSGEELAVITALKTLFTLSYA